MVKRFILFSIFFTLFTTGYSQYNYRLNADILTKTRLPDSTFQISKGKVHYDKNIQKIIFDFTFPEKEKVILFDTLIYTFRSDELIQTHKNFLIPNQSVFHFILSGDISNYGLENSIFEAKEIEKKGDMIITTWLPPENIQPYLSKILVATKNKQLYSITMMGKDEKVINRQILKNYQLVDGLEIPCEILIMTHLNEGIMYQIITLDKVVLNETEDQNYDFEL